MTGGSKCDRSDLGQVRPSLLPFNPADLVRIRLRPAELARAFDVTKQTVSQWEKKGWIARGPDGRIDPYVAARSVFAKADPARMRARIFREAMQTQQELRKRIEQLESERAGIKSAMRFRLEDEQARKLAELCDAIADDFDVLAGARLAGDLDGALDRLCASIFYGISEADAEGGDESSDAAYLWVSPAKPGP